MQDFSVGTQCEPIDELFGCRSRSYDVELGPECSIFLRQPRDDLMLYYLNFPRIERENRLGDEARLYGRRHQPGCARD